MKIILILAIWYTADALAITSIEFDDMQACEQAGRDFKAIWGSTSIRWTCSPKGNRQ